MVDVLCQRGQADAADELERRWNALAATRKFSLLCGYRLDVFDTDAQLEALPRICREHSHVLPARNYPRFARAVDEALREVVARTRRRRSTCSSPVAWPPTTRCQLAQLVLMWVSANLPVHSAQILASARAHYVRPAA